MLLTDCDGPLHAEHLDLEVHPAFPASVVQASEERQVTEETDIPAVRRALYRDHPRLPARLTTVSEIHAARSRWISGWQL